MRQLLVLLLVLERSARLSVAVPPSLFEKLQRVTSTKKNKNTCLALLENINRAIESAR